jgi:hypothetical protein
LRRERRGPKGAPSEPVIGIDRPRAAAIGADVRLHREVSLLAITLEHFPTFIP